MIHDILDIIFLEALKCDDNFVYIMRLINRRLEKNSRSVVKILKAGVFCDVDVVHDDNGKATYQRVLRTKPKPGHYDAGDRTGLLPEVLPLDYPLFQQAFNEAIATKKS